MTVKATRNGRFTEYERRSASDVLTPLIDIGIALTSEGDLAVLLERIVAEARRFTNAEAGTLFLREGEALRFRSCRTSGWSRASTSTRCAAD